MKKATIENREIVDAIAMFHLIRKAPETIIEVALRTKALPGEQVQLADPYTVATVVRSRHYDQISVAHFTATKWIELRFTKAHQRLGAPDHDQVAPPKR